MLPSASQFQYRVEPSLLAEKMDGPCSYEDFRACLIDIAKSNKVLAGHRPIMHWIASLTPQPHPLRILDVGCGGGDLLRHIADWAKRKNVPVQLTGIDLNPMAVRAATEFSATYPHIRWITGNAQELSQQEEIDIVTCSLCAHHMSSSEIIALLRWMERTARRGWFISDLRRSRMNYVLFQCLSRVARWHRFVQYDGPVSIRRGFDTRDWQTLCSAAGLANVTMQDFFPGRLCVSKRYD